MGRANSHLVSFQVRANEALRNYVDDLDEVGELLVVAGDSLKIVIAKIAAMNSSEVSALNREARFTVFTDQAKQIRKLVRKNKDFLGIVGTAMGEIERAAQLSRGLAVDTKKSIVED